jgi:hypothetical protein
MKSTQLPNCPVLGRMAVAIAVRPRPGVYKELHGSAYSRSQLPGRIVFDYKQLSSNAMRCKGEATCYINPRPNHNPGGKLVLSY